MLPIVLGLIAAVIVIFIVVVAMQPAEFSVERSTEIPAPSADVFPHVNTLRRWEAWSPWAKRDPNMNTTYSGPESGVGASYAWNGNKDVGQGRMEITESRPNEHIGMRLEFMKPMKATNTVNFRFEPVGGNTRVVWSMNGTNNFMGKAFGLFMNMDKMVGGDFEQGLASMKAAVQAGSGK